MQDGLDILKIFASVSTPLGLGGLIAGAFFLLVRQILGKPISKLSEPHGHELAMRVTTYFFVLSLVAVALGFAGFLMGREGFDLTMHASAPEGDPAAPMGEILLRLEQHVDTASIDSHGNAVFKREPRSLLGKNVEIQSHVVGYIDEWQTVKVGADTVWIVLKPAVVTFSGSVEPPPKEPGSMRVLADGAERDGVPDEFGRFTMQIRGKPGDRVRVQIFLADRTMVYDDYQSLPGPVRLLISNGRR
jgi:hypothetical protein